MKNKLLNKGSGDMSKDEKKDDSSKKINIETTRKKNDELRDFINTEIADNSSNWTEAHQKNFGDQFQDRVRRYYSFNKKMLGVKSVEQNQNPNDRRGDVIITQNNGDVIEYEVKSCKNGNLEGVTICNTPELLNAKPAYLINYTINKDGVVYVIDVYDTQVFRLTSINKKGKYKGCLRGNRDTGKKIKGRPLNEFLLNSDDTDNTLQELTSPEIIRKTVLMYSASKFVDDKYNFTDEEILDAIHKIKKNMKKKTDD